MPIRFQADADFNQIILSAVIRRSPEVSFRTATNGTRSLFLGCN